jgi:hypothetical protein
MRVPSSITRNAVSEAIRCRVSVTHSSPYSVSIRWLPVSLTSLAIGVSLWLAYPAPLTAVDQEQPRLNQAAPAPHGAATLEQTFVAAHNGLSAVEVLGVAYPDSPSSLALSLVSPEGQQIASATFSGFAHNSPLRLSFAPLPHSAGQTYTLLITGSEENQASIWSYSVDGYAPGSQFVGEAPSAGDLRFSTTYTYLWADVARDLLADMLRLMIYLPILWAVLFAPGLFVLDLLIPGRYGGWSRWGMALGLSLALLPLAWLWATTLSLRLGPVTTGLFYLLVGGVTLWHGWRAFRAHPSTFRLTLSAHDGFMVLILLISILVRLLAIRDLAFPQWVDSPHHYAIARLLASTGQAPATYSPLYPIDGFLYHFSFHALAVTFHWLTTLPLVETILFLGQVLNGLMPLAAYTFVAALTGRPRAGLAAAFFCAFISFFPGYYLAWGRYTQLTGLLVLAPTMVGLWRLAGGPAQVKSERWRTALMAGLLLAGLLLAHYRVLAFGVTFAWAALAAGRRGGWRRLARAGALVVLLSFPWLIRLGGQAIRLVLEMPDQLAASTGYNAFPLEYFRSSLERGWIVVAVLLGLWGLARRERVVWLIAGWIALTFALLNIGPGTWVVNNNSWAISLFLPGAVLLGWGVDQWLSEAEGLTQAGAHWARRLSQAVMRSAAVGVLAYAGVRGLPIQTGMVNAATVLATEADAPALEWIAHHTPEDAMFLVNSWHWQAGLWASSDAGYWIWPLTGRRTTMPTLDYAFDRAWLAEVNAFNEGLARVTDFSSPQTVAQLRAAGVSHVFIGAKGGNLKPEMFVGNPYYRLLYANGAVWVFELVSSGEN